MTFAHPIRRSCIVAAAACLATALLPGSALRAQQGTTVQRLAPGISYWTQRDARGPWNVHVVRVDLAHPQVQLRAARATGQLRGRERTSAMAARANDSTNRVRVAINADFFDLKTGENENNQVMDGEWWKGLMVTDSPYDTYDNVHAQFALGANRRAAVGRYVLEGRAWLRGTMTPVLTVNAMPVGKYEGTALYTARYGARTPADTVRKTAELALTRAGARGDTLLYVANAAPAAVAGSRIPADGAVLVAYGDRTPAWQGANAGDTVRVLLTTLPHLADDRAPALVLGGWPRLLEHGVNVAGDAAIREGTISHNAEVRHPRTAIGVSRDGRTLWLYVVDGRSTASVGMTTSELADALRALGAWDALNFDGGGSTTMVVNDAVVSTPSDATGEREVGNALLIIERRAPPRK